MWRRLKISRVHTSIGFTGLDCSSVSGGEGVLFDPALLKHEKPFVPGLKLRRFEPHDIMAGRKLQGYAFLIAAAFVHGCDVDHSFMPHWIVFAEWGNWFCWGYQRVHRIS